MPAISFLILTYNSSQYLKSLFDSFEKFIGQEIQSGKYEIIIIDNASTDATALEIKKYTGENIRFFQNLENSGYASGINMASKKARGEILIAVNPDARLDQSDFDKVLQAFGEDRLMAIAGMSIENETGEREKNAGKFYNFFSFLLYCMGLDDVMGLRFAPSKKMKVDFVSGGFVAFRKKTFEKLKGFDEDYFMYVEDMDICYRAKKMGLSTYYLPYAKIIHKGQGSSNREFAVTNIYKGLITFYKKHGTFLTILYVKSLLRIKAASIIFLGSLSNKKNLVATYTKALKSI